MKYNNIVRIALLTLSLLTMGSVYATSPQKSTIITLTGHDVGKPEVCAQNLPCLLRSAGIDFIYQHGSDRVTVFDMGNIHAACAAGWEAGKDLTIVKMNETHTCSR